MFTTPSLKNNPKQNLKSEPDVNTGPAVASLVPSVALATAAAAPEPVPYVTVAVPVPALVPHPAGSGADAGEILQTTVAEIPQSTIILGIPGAPVVGIPPGMEVQESDYGK